jgi:hypothetical protein
VVIKIDFQFVSIIITSEDKMTDTKAVMKEATKKDTKADVKEKTKVKTKKIIKNILDSIIQNIQWKPLHEYQKGIKFNDFKGVEQPLHLIGENIPRKNELTNFVCSIKPDSIFTMIIIDEKRICYYVYPKERRMYRIGKSTFKNIRCIGELVTEDKFNNKIRPFIILFDLLGTKLNQMEIKKQVYLSERVKFLKEVVKSITLDECFLSKIFVKEYFPIKKLGRVLNPKIKSDGIIFTPIRSDLGFKVIRWKPYPTITVGFEVSKKDKCYYMYLWDKKRKKKVFCNHESLHFKVYKKELSTTLESFTTEEFFKKNFLDFEPGWDGKTYPKDILVELYMKYDCFSNKYNSANGLQIKRFRTDKNYPDDISIGEDLFNLMKNPISLNTLLRKKSLYSRTIGLKGKLSHEWSSFMFQTKSKLYDKYVKSGKLLDLGSGSGADINIYYRISSKKNIPHITMVENDGLQCDFLRDKTHYIEKDNIANRNCILTIKKADINDNDLPTIVKNKYDTVVLSNSIQFAINSTGMKNIQKVIKKDGNLIIIFMDGNCLNKHIEDLKKYHNPNDLYEYNDIYELGSGNKWKYLYDSNTYSEEDEYNDYKDKEVTDFDIYKDSTGIFYKYHGYVEFFKDNRHKKPEYVEVKLPWAKNAVVEPIVYFDILKYQLYNRGFSLIDCGKLSYFYDKEMKRHIRNLNSVYKYAVFKFTNYKTFNSLFKYWDKGLFYILSFLLPCEMEQVSYTCKTLRQKVYEYIQKNSYEKQRFQEEYFEEDSVFDGWT